MILKFKKLKHVVVTLLIFGVLFFTLAVNAVAKSNWLLLEEEGTCPAKDIVAEDSVFNKSYSAVYKFISDNEYLFTPLSSAIAGQVRCGVWCAALGGVLGAVDEALVSFGYSDQYYLIWGVFGVATGHVIQPSMVSNVAGVAVGILLPMGALNNHKELVAPLVSGMAGYSTSGAIGLINGVAAGVFDEFAIYEGVIDKHQMTFCTVGMATTRLLGLSNTLVTDFFGVILGGLIAANYEEQVIATLTAPVKTTKNLYNTYGKFIPEKQLNAHIEKHALFLVGSQFMMQYLTQKATEHRQNINYHFERLDVIGGPAWDNFRSDVISFAIFIFPYVVGQTVSGRIDNYFCKKLQYALEDEVRTKLFSGETFLRLSHDSNTTVLTDNLKDDISIITESGSGLVTGAVSASIGGIYGVGIIIVTAPNIFVYSSLYNQAQLLIANYLAAQQRFYGEKIRKINSDLISVIKHDTENIRTVTERDGVEFTRMRLQQLYDTLREYEASREIWSSANSIWWSVSGIADYMLNYCLVGDAVNRGKISFDSRSKVQTASWQVSDLLSWPGHSAQSIATIEQSLDHITFLESNIHSQSGSIDQINRITTEENLLKLQDLEIGVVDRVLVAVKDLELEMGKVYAITGETGCGKTSWLSKIKGVKENGISGKGNIYYPLINHKAPKIVMLSQLDYFPIAASLQEIITYPEKIPSDPVLQEEQTEEILLLLKEIGLEAFNTTNVVGEDDNKNRKEKNNTEESNVLHLNSVKDWYTLFSGGEKKKIMIVSAIIKKPDILILDEVCNGLDQIAKITVQQMLKKYLPNTLILSVDHHAQDNNYNCFYYKNLHFSAKSMALQDIPSKTQCEELENFAEKE